MSAEDRDDEDQAEEEPYVKADRRASREVADGVEDAADEAPEEEQAADADAEEPPADEAAEPPPEEGERPDINVYGLLRMSIGMYVEQAWIHMGVRMDPNTQKVEADLPLAKVAIDTVGFLVEQLAVDLDEAEKRELDSLIANLRVNYVQRA